MQCEDAILKLMLDSNKPQKIVMDCGLKVKRPEVHAILPEEVYLSTSNPYDEIQVIACLKKLWLVDHKVKSYEKIKDENSVTWWELK